MRRGVAWAIIGVSSRDLGPRKKTPMMYTLHLIASEPSHGDTHVDPDPTASVLGMYATEDAAVRAGREYLREHPTAWLQTADSDGDFADVEAVL